MMLRSGMAYLVDLFLYAKALWGSNGAWSKYSWHNFRLVDICGSADLLRN